MGVAPSAALSGPEKVRHCGPVKPVSVSPNSSMAVKVTSKGAPAIGASVDGSTTILASRCRASVTKPLSKLEEPQES